MRIEYSSKIKVHVIVIVARMINQDFSFIVHINNHLKSIDLA